MVNIVREVNDWAPIRRVLVSVSDKTGLEMFISELVKISKQVHFYTTGGTYSAIADFLGPGEVAQRLTPVSEYTGQPETQGGLVKTLDFKVYLGLLTETYNPAHQADLVRTGAVPIDMVVVNLHPFEKTIARKGVTVEEARAHIDVGGPTMIRAAAKNYLRVAAIVDPADYAPVLEMLRANKGALDLQTRFRLACKAFKHTAHYDAAISEFLAQQAAESIPPLYTLV